MYTVYIYDIRYMYIHIYICTCTVYLCICTIYIYRIYMYMYRIFMYTPYIHRGMVLANLMYDTFLQACNDAAEGAWVTFQGHNVEIAH
jgi:hypothetical protein